eukprot:m.363617 g.363617  ORF g.363617 m.363617 type:complete len:300 (-) comp23208_c0_seq1:107-1006(-)
MVLEAQLNRFSAYQRQLGAQLQRLRATVNSISAPRDLASHSNVRNARFYYPLGHAEIPVEPKEFVPSVTTVLDHFYQPSRFFALRNWQKSQVAKHGEDGAEQMRESILSQGTELHAFCEAVLANQEPVFNENCEVGEQLRESILPYLKKIATPNHISELTLYSPFEFAGTLDLLIRDHTSYRKRFLLVDFKTSTKPKKTVSSLFDYPQQLAAYRHLLLQHPNTDLLQRHGINHSSIQGQIVVAYRDGSPADIHTFSPAELDEHMDEFCKKLEAFRVNHSNNYQYYLSHGEHRLPGSTVS